ncbi:hypothetical protein DICVIV_11157 [Dictyocaulus viviparus]|uniref:Uncharacterized protein n=1 Tax=Dictyocaulus viviparus TaxID=29172 RepID=A0A0D8XGK1_DICVI|nr:hypothetical protein DICVIV_11157 [Dictyocaulus viviparus]
MNYSFEEQVTTWNIEGKNIKWLSELLLYGYWLNISSYDTPIFTPNIPQYVNVGLLVLYCIIVPLNIIFLIAILPEITRRIVMKLKLLICTLIGVSIMWSLTWLFLLLILLIERSEVMSFVSSTEEEISLLRAGIWELVAHQLIENLLTVQSILIFAISIDRYLNLFSSYNDSCENIFIKLLFVVLPFLLAATVFDHRMLTIVLPLESAVFCRLCLLLCPSMFSVTLLVITLFPTRLKHGFKQRFQMSLNTTLPQVMLSIVALDVFWRTAFFFQLFELNFGFRIVTGNEDDDRFLRDFLLALFEVGYLTQISSLLHPSI